MSAARFRDRRSGAVYEPADERVAGWMARNPALVPVEGGRGARRKRGRRAAEDGPGAAPAAADGLGSGGEAATPPAGEE